jgi:hypothetical protein
MPEKARVVTIGYVYENYRGSGRPCAQFWHMEGGDYPGYDASATGDDDPVMGGWSLNELRKMAATVGRHIPDGVAAQVRRLSDPASVDARGQGQGPGREVRPPLFGLG